MKVFVSVRSHKSQSMKHFAKSTPGAAQAVKRSDKGKPGVMSGDQRTLARADVTWTPSLKGFQIST